MTHFILCFFSGVALGLGGALAWVIGTKIGNKVWDWAFKA